MGKITDAERTLQILRERGSEGIHSFHLNHLVGTIRAAARVNELKRAGYNIISKPERMNGKVGVRYFLIGSGVPKNNAPVEKKYIWVTEGNTARRVEVNQ